MSGKHRAERNRKMNTGTKQFEKVELFRYLRTNHNYIREEIKRRGLRVRECLPSCGAETFVCEFAIQECKHEDNTVV